MRLLLINNATFDSASLIQELHRLEPIETLELIDHLPPEAPIAGIATRFHAMIAVQQGEYADVDWSRIPPLDEPTLLALSECETIFLKALEKNGKFSKLLDREVQRRSWGMPRIDSFATSASYEWRKHLYLKHLRFWKHTLEAARIDVMVATIIPHHGYDYVIYRLCKLMGIRVLFYDHTPVDDWILPKEDIETSDQRIATAFAAARQAYGAAPERIVLPELAERFLSEQTSRAKDPTPYYMDPARIDGWEYAPVRADAKTVKSLVRDAAAFVKNYVLGAKRRAAAKLLAHSIALRWLKQTELDRLLAYWDRLAVPPDFTHPNIYFPLHFQPEISTSPLAGVFAEQLLVAQMLSYHLPEGWRIYVKEHPYQKSLARTATFYRELSRLPNVVLVPREANTFDLIDKCTAVATCTGRAGWEALFRGKPVFAFGETPFNYAPGVFRIRTAAECRAAMTEIAAGGVHPTLAELRIFFKALESITVRGNLMAATRDEVKRLSGLTPEDIAINIARDIATRYREPPETAATETSAGRIASHDDGALGHEEAAQ